MRYSLLAAASLIAVAYAAPANAEDCGCRDQVRAALARQAPVAARPAHAENFYDYRAAGPVDMAAYRHRWDVAPQGYVPPPHGYGPPDMPYGAPQGMSYSNPAYPDGWAYAYQPPGITIDQGGWFGGVGYPQQGGGDDGGGGGGGGVLTLAQPDSLNGPNYNNFGQSYGGAYRASNQLGAWRAEAFAPKSK